MARVANREMGAHTAAREEFTNNNGTCFGRLWYGDRYAVFSYGHHWPLVIFDRDAGWFYNSDKYSNTTSRHLSHCLSMIRHCAKPLDSESMIDFVTSESYSQFVAKKLTRPKSTNTFEEARP